ncbi:MAG: hypothetical protein LBH06_01510 [Rikenellaceae bacterium]|jgi:hypothetical protein|nr:hypothetical protein [Rikenellaceae bacterium]
MKKLLIIVAFLTLSLSSSAALLTPTERGKTVPTIAANYVDEFKGYKVVETSWDWLLRPIAIKQPICAYFRIRRINDDYYFGLKIMLTSGQVFAIEKAAEIIFILDDGSKYTINSTSYEVSSKGAGAIGLSGSGAQGINIQYLSVLDPNFSILAEKKVKKMRIYTTDGYLEDDIPEKGASNLQTALN